MENETVHLRPLRRRNLIVLLEILSPKGCTLSLLNAHTRAGEQQQSSNSPNMRNACKWKTINATMPWNTNDIHINTQNIRTTRRFHRPRFFFFHFRCCFFFFVGSILQHSVFNTLNNIGCCLFRLIRCVSLNAPRHRQNKKRKKNKKNSWLLCLRVRTGLFYVRLLTWIFHD